MFGWWFGDRRLEKATESEGIPLASLDYTNQFTVWLGKKKKKDIQGIALKSIRRVVKGKRCLANLEKSLGKDCQTQLQARAPANTSERLSQADVIFRVLCGIYIFTWPKQPPFYYHLYTRALTKALQTWLRVRYEGRQLRTTSVVWGTKGCLSACESGSEKWLLFHALARKEMWVVKERLCQRARGVILKRQPERYLQNLPDF